MNKKIVHIFSVYLAFGIILAHNVVPHHHHIDKISHSKNHHTHPSSDHKGDLDLAHLLGDFHHDGDMIEFIKHNVAKITKYNNGDDLSFFAVLPCELSSIEVSSLRFEFLPPEDPPLIPYTYSFGLRAPPACI